MSVTITILSFSERCWVLVRRFLSFLFFSSTLFGERERNGWLHDKQHNTHAIYNILPPISRSGKPYFNSNSTFLISIVLLAHADRSFDPTCVGGGPFLPAARCLNHNRFLIKVLTRHFIHSSFFQIKVLPGTHSFVNSYQPCWLES